jgi:hypothetical protein
MLVDYGPRLPKENFQHCVWLLCLINFRSCPGGVWAFPVIYEAAETMVSFRYLVLFSYIIYEESVVGHGVVTTSSLKLAYGTLGFDRPGTAFDSINVLVI